MCVAVSQIFLLFFGASLVQCCDEMPGLRREFWHARARCWLCVTFGMCALAADDVDQVLNVQRERLGGKVSICARGSLLHEVVRCDRVIIHSLNVQFSFAVNSCSELGLLQRSSTGPPPYNLTVDSLTSNLAFHVMGVHDMATQCVA